MAVGIVVPDVATAFYAAALKGAQERLEAAGYHVLVVNTERAARREREAIRHAGRPSGGRPDRRDLGRIRGHRRARRVLRQRAGGRRRGSGRAGEPVGHHAAGRASGPGARSPAHRLPGPARQRAARHAVHLAGRAGADRGVPSRGRARRARASAGLRPHRRSRVDRGGRARHGARSCSTCEHAPTAIVAGTDMLAMGVLAGGARPRARDPAATWRWSRSTSHRSPTCSIRRSRRSTGTTASSATAPPTCF